MASPGESRSRISATLREGEQVTPLELFFDLVFVLAFTQCTALMAHHPTWDGLVQGLLILGVLWWTWVGYAWLTSVVDPEEGAVRLVMFGAMAALLLVSLCVPEAFDTLALAFALIYGVVRIAHVALFILASPEDDALRHSVLALAASTMVAVTLLVAASLLDGFAQGALWALALFLDMAGPYFFGSEGWKLVPRHFAERHGLIVIIALGESIVAIVAARRLEEAEPGKVQNEMARDSYSFLHLPMIAGIILVALGLKKTIGHFDDPLDLVPAFALLGGLAAYLLGHVAFRYRHIHTINRRRLGLAIILLALLPVAVELPALATVAITTVLLWALIAYETRSYGEGRHRVRHPEQAAA